jgi:thymidylate kinase
MTKNYTCVSIDGIDVSGKSIAIVKVKKQLELDGYEVVIFKDFSENYPDKNYKSFIAEIREFVLNPNSNYATLPKTINPLLFTVARLKMIEDIKRYINTRHKDVILTLKPLVIILDRYVHSTLAYQVSLGCDIQLVEYLCHHACTLLKPNLSILLDIDYLTYIERINKRKSKFIDDTESQLIKEDIFNDIQMNFIANFESGYAKYADQHLIIDNNVFSDTNIDLIISKIKSVV